MVWRFFLGKCVLRVQYFGRVMGEGYFEKVCCKKNILGKCDRSRVFWESVMEKDILGVSHENSISGKCDGRRAFWKSVMGEEYFGKVLWLKGIWGKCDGRRGCGTM